MKKCYLDSNFLVYFSNEGSPFFLQAREKLEKLATDGVELFISPLALDEFFHAFGFEISRKEKSNLYEELSNACGFILQLPLLKIVNPPVDPISQLQVVSLMKNYSLHPRDAYHLLTMQSNNIDSFATFDTDFRRVFAAKILQKA